MIPTLLAEALLKERYRDLKHEADQMRLVHIAAEHRRNEQQNERCDVRNQGTRISEFVPSQRWVVCFARRLRGIVQEQIAALQTAQGE
jgi:hypothetical protein